MQFNCGPTWYERYKRRCQWHRWYAWWPVRVQDSKHTCIWLEPVWRRLESGYSGTYGVYRLHVDSKELPGEPA